MIRVVSRSDRRAEIVVSEPNGKRTTLHVQFVEGGWRDKYGTTYDIDDTNGGVNWFLYYRNQVENFTKGRAFQWLNAKQEVQFFKDIRSMAHSLRSERPDLFEQEAA